MAGKEQLHHGQCERKHGKQHHERHPKELTPTAEYAEQIGDRHDEEIDQQIPEEMKLLSMNEMGGVRGPDGRFGSLEHEPLPYRKREKEQSSEDQRNGDEYCEIDRTGLRGDRSPKSSVR